MEAMGLVGRGKAVYRLAWVALGLLEMPNLSGSRLKTWQNLK